MANARAQSRQKAQQLRQKARQTIFNKRRNQQQQQQQRTNSTPKQSQPSTSVTGIKQRLGIAPVRGRGGRGRGRGRSQAQSLDVGGASGSRPGSQLKNIRYTVCFVWLLVYFRIINNCEIDLGHYSHVIEVIYLCSKLTTVLIIARAYRLKKRPCNCTLIKI